MRQGAAAAVAFLLLATSMFLPWWVLRNEAADGTIAAETPWTGGSEVDSRWTWAVRVLVPLAIALLFVRVAAASWRHEPRSWVRDLAITLGLLAAALASAWMWPRDLPFWGTQDFTLGDMRFVLVGRPGLGWWLAALSGALLALELWLSRRATRPTA